jgi:hypothetical protein
MPGLRSFVPQDAEGAISRACLASWRGAGAGEYLFFLKKFRNEYGIWELERRFAGIFPQVGDRLLKNGGL